MITLTETLPQKEPTSAAEIRIYSLHKAYGGSGIALFWLQKDEKENITAIISKMDNAVTVCAQNNADFEEIAPFISVVGGQTVLSNLPLPLHNERQVYQLSYIPNSVNKINLPQPDYKDAYSIMSTRFDMPTYEVWYPDTCHRVRHNSALLVSNGKGALCGLLGGSSMLIVGLCSTPQSEGEGVATKLLDEIVNSNLAKTYTVLAEESLKQYYVNQNFDVLGKHYIYGDV